MAPDDVSLGEVARRLNALHQDVRELRNSIVERDDLSATATAWEASLRAHEQKMDLRFTQSDLEHRQLRRDIDTLQAWQTWAARIVLGAVLLAVLGVSLTLGTPS